jgi:hypothetical protein
MNATASRAATGDQDRHAAAEAASRPRRRPFGRTCLERHPRLPWRAGCTRSSSAPATQAVVQRRPSHGDADDRHRAVAGCPSSATRRRPDADHRERPITST